MRIEGGLFGLPTERHRAVVGVTQVSITPPTVFVGVAQGHTERGFVLKFDTHGIFRTASRHARAYGAVTVLAGQIAGSCAPTFEIRVTLVTDLTGAAQEPAHYDGTQKTKHRRLPDGGLK